ncbi:MAG TPA: WecB/TagA/CpsF family glycosyltransferase [Solirubrobacteraceae bacterium]|nr:WecB/TagA/CpsF family glycosyltransferase [Solirubrobacteraceae bacterium]
MLGPYPPAPLSKLAEQPPAPPPSAAILGVPLAITDYAQVIDWIDATIASGSRGSLSAAAVHLVMRAQEDPAVMAAVLGLSVVVPDGQPLVWALRALGHAGATRVYGPDLMAAYCEHAARSGTPAFLYGGRNEDVLVELSVALRTRFPGLRVTGGYAPPFRELSEEEDEEIALRIERSGAEVVWVGIGQPRQELWIARMRERLSAPVLIAVGAAFDFHAGLVPQAPAWMGRHGLEWSYRLAREPRRLWRRYARYNPRFLAAFARQYGQAWRERHGRSA